MTYPQTRRRRGFTLLEVIVILPMLTLLFGVMIWAINYQYKTSRAMADQAARQETMYRILAAMRADLLAANELRVVTYDGDAASHAPITDAEGPSPAGTDAVRATAARVVVQRRGGDIEYVLLVDTDAIPRSENSTLPDNPPRYHLVRLDPTDDVPARVWPLRTLRMRMSAEGDGESSGSRLIRIVFESTHEIDARVPIRRVFDTTLRVGGSS